MRTLLLLSISSQDSINTTLNGVIFQDLKKGPPRLTKGCTLLLGAFASVKILKKACCMKHWGNRLRSSSGRRTACTMHNLRCHPSQCLHGRPYVSGCSDNSPSSMVAGKLQSSKRWVILACTRFWICGKCECDKCDGKKPGGEEQIGTLRGCANVGLRLGGLGTNQPNN